MAKAVEAGLLPKRAVQAMDCSPMLGAAAVQDTYKLLRTALHKLVKGHKKELPAELMPRLKRYLQTGKPDIDWEDREARRQELQQLVADAELALKELPAETDKPVASTARALLEQVAHQDVEGSRPTACRRSERGATTMTSATLPDERLRAYLSLPAEAAFAGAREPGAITWLEGTHRDATW
ncbi:MAG TPA: hypothetical protein VLW53_05085 [Candidatus Eisenbacteria bacterium]|nr:hypothetical protein [Candidatus Eisenbacteria bacterium]